MKKLLGSLQQPACTNETARDAQLQLIKEDLAQVKNLLELRQQPRQCSANDSSNSREYIKIIHFLCVCSGVGRFCDFGL